MLCYTTTSPYAAPEYIIAVALYYLIPALVSVFLGTLINFFLTKTAGNKLASIGRSFAYTVCKTALLFVVYYCFSFYENWILVLIPLEFLLFRHFFRANLLRGMRFIFISNVFSISAQIILAPGLYKFFAGFIY